MTSSVPDRGPNVRFPPPLAFVLGFAIGTLIERVWPLALRFPEWPSLSVVGLVLFAGGMAVVATGMLTFRHHRTAIYPNQPARNLVTTGIYAYTRNPMYVGLTVAYLGGIFATGLFGPLCVLPAVLAIIQTKVIAREERHLRERFPEEYAAYTSRVRRWI